MVCLLKIEWADTKTCFSDFRQFMLLKSHMPGHHTGMKARTLMEIFEK